MVSAALKQDIYAAPVKDYGPLIEQARAQFKEQNLWKENSGCAFIKPNGRIEVQSDVCHSFMDGRNCKYFINGLQEGSGYGENPGRILPKETELWFVDYILNRSPYAEVFVDKDPVVALETSMVLVCGDHPGNLVGAAVVALRRLSEHIYVAQAAYDLHKAGVHEDLAFLLGHTIQCPSKIKPPTLMSWNNNLNWHTSVDIGLMNFKAIKNFMQHKIETPNEWYSDKGRYTGYSKMYGEDWGNGLSQYIIDNFPYHLYKDGVVEAKVISTNPFEAAKKALAKAQPKVVNYAHTVPYEKGIRVMAEWAKTHLMEKINDA